MQDRFHSMRIAAGNAGCGGSYSGLWARTKAPLTVREKPLRESRSVSRVPNSGAQQVFARLLSFRPPGWCT
jgi:hypothetical protein